MTHWHTASLPDSETTVLLSMPDAEDEPVWPGYHDGEIWRLADGMPAPAVNAWAEMPAPLELPPLRVTTAAELRQQAAHDTSCVGAFARARPGRA